MEEIYIGDLIKKRRHELGLTQEELCFGICEPMTISRIENGRQLPSPAHLKMILQRLDLPEDGICKYISKKEYDNYKKLRKILKQYVEFQFCDKIKQEELLNESIKEINLMKNEYDISSSNYQLLSLIENEMLFCEDKLQGDEYINQITDEICKTNPKFSIDDISKHLYNYIEFTTIILLARAYHLSGYNSTANSLFKQLIQYAKEHEILSYFYNELLIYLMMNYLVFLEESKKYEVSYQLALYCKKLCIENKEYQFLPFVVEIEADCLLENNENKEEAMELYKEVYYCYELFDNQYRLEIVKQKIENGSH